MLISILINVQYLKNVVSGFQHWKKVWMVKMTSSAVDYNHQTKQSPSPAKISIPPEGYFPPKHYLENPTHYKQKTYFSLPNHQRPKN